MAELMQKYECFEHCECSYPALLTAGDGLALSVSSRSERSVDILLEMPLSAAGLGERLCFLLLVDCCLYVSSVSKILSTFLRVAE